MDAPDSGWILLKREWLPIELLLNQLAPDAENSRDRINRLSGSLDAQCIRDLHVLRVQRNRVLHHDQALNHSMYWATTARRVRRDLESLLRARSMVSRMREPTAPRAAISVRQSVRLTSQPTLPQATDGDLVWRLMVAPAAPAARHHTGQCALGDLVAAAVGLADVLAGHCCGGASPKWGIDRNHWRARMVLSSCRF